MTLVLAFSICDRLALGFHCSLNKLQRESISSIFLNLIYPQLEMS